MPVSVESVLRFLKDKDIKYLRILAVDLLGYPRVVTVSERNFSEAIEEGIGVDGSSIPGFTGIEESDLLIKPDLNTLILAPWDSPKTAWIIGDFIEHDGKPFEKDPRLILRRNLEEIHRLGFRALIGSELEFFLITGENPKPLDDGYYYSPEPAKIGDEICRETIESLTSFNVLKYHHEVAQGQYELSLEASDPLTMADRIFLAKLALKFIAKERGITATFMPKPFWGMNGSGVHVHVSLWKDDENLFHESEEGISKNAVNFINGILAHARAISAIVAPTVNSYKRLVPGYEAPVYIAWAYSNRSAIIRVPSYFLKKKDRAHIEYRHPDPSFNPYLSFSVIIKAGLEGIKKGMESKPVNTNLYHLSDEERAKIGIDSLPKNLKEAVEDLSKDSLIKEVLGEEAYRSFIKLKLNEYEEYISNAGDWDSTKYTITQWEYRKYLNV